MTPSHRSAEHQVRGFVLQPTYRIVRGRPVVHLFGRLESGGSFLVRDRREVPRFYVAARDVLRARELGARPLTPTPRETMNGEPVVRVEVPTPADAPPLRDRLHAHGVPTFEADVRFAMRYLIDRGIRGGVEIRGPAAPGAGADLVFDDPEIVPAEVTPTLSVLSIDIETDPRAHRLFSVALSGCGASDVLLYGPEELRCPPDATGFASERALLEALFARVRELDPDVITGWNVVDFDLVVLARLAARLRVPFAVGRGPGVVRLRPGRGRARAEATVPGRVVLDGIDLLRGASIRMADYSLDAVAREVVGEGKLLAHGDRGAEIERLFRHDRARLVAYNRTDARLVIDILERLRLVELAVERSLLTGLPPDRVAASVAAFDTLYLTELGRRSIVAPTVAVAGEGPAVPGGLVLEPRPGLYDGVLVFDFRSLYPSLIRTFQIDPLGLARSEEGGIEAPNGAVFRREQGILPTLLDELGPRRAAADAAGDEVRSYAIKILMNSFFGVLGTPGCRFADPRLAGAVTTFGRTILSWAREWFQERELEVLYGDTDSLFVAAGVADPEAARGLGHDLAARLNRDLAEHVSQRWGVSSRLELEFERIYLKLHLPPVRHGTAGAMKRYAGLVEGDGAGGEPRVVLTGMEAVRRDWTELAHRVQRELYRRLFLELPLESWLATMVRELRGGEHDALLVYRKALRKDPEAYTTTTPPHVVAARKAGVRAGGLVAYVMTTAGPEPASHGRHPIDHEHYVEKQVRPVAGPILDLLGLDFARVVGDDRQLSLF